MKKAHNILAANILVITFLILHSRSAHAVPVTIDFSGSVFSVIDSLASLFAGADRVVGSLTFENSIPDTVPSPDEGRYPGSLISLSASIPGLGMSWSTSAGETAVFPTSPPSSFVDQFFGHGDDFDATGTSVGGFTISSISVGFFGTAMLTDDSLPGSSLNWEDGNLFLSFVDTGGVFAGNATVGFTNDAPAPGTVSLMLAALFGSDLAKRIRRVRESPGR